MLAAVPSQETPPDARLLAAQDFDPFEIPMPVVAPGVAPEDAFAELDADGDGIIKGEEFAAIPKSDKFNKVTRDEMVRILDARGSQATSKSGLSS